MKNDPVAKFWYAGQSHSHPVRRTVLLIWTSKTHFGGYEIRNGAKTVDLRKAPVKTYERSKVARVEQVDRKCNIRKTSEPKSSTFRRYALLELLEQGA